MEKSIRNYVIRHFSSAQYSCSLSSKRELCFVNTNNTVEIKYDIRQYPLMRHIKELRLYLSVRFGDDSITFSPKHLKLLDTDIDCLVCADKDEFEQAIIQVTDFLTTSAIPLLNLISQSAINLDNSFYALLSADTSQQAKRFAVRYNRNLQFTSENKDWAENWLHQLWENTPCEQRNAFRNNLSEIIEFAAYIGELLLSEKKEGYWTWVDIPDEAKQKYGVFFPALEDGCDPLLLVIRYWNFNHYIHDVNLFPNNF